MPEAPPDPDPAPWRRIAAAGIVGLFLGVAFPFVRVDSWEAWATRLRSALFGGWIDLQTPLTAGAFGVTAAAAVYAFPRVRPGWILLLGSLFGVLNEAWQAGFLVRHPQLGDAAAAVLGVTVGVGLARRLPGLGRFGRPAAGTLAAACSLAFAVVLALAAWKSEARTERWGTGPPDGFLAVQVADHGGFEGTHRWRVSVPFHTPERALYRPDGRRGVPMGASMGLIAGLAAAGLGRTPSGRFRWALAGSAAPFAVVLFSLLAWDAAWQGIPTGLALGAVIAAVVAGGARGLQRFNLQRRRLRRRTRVEATGVE